MARYDGSPFLGGRLSALILRIAGKQDRMAALAEIAADVAGRLAAEDPEGAVDADGVREVVRSLEKKSVRARILDEGLRADGRSFEEVRAISCETGVLPRTHGSALFTRGETQSLGVVTLGTSRDEQRIDSIDTPEQITKSFMLHYNFPPFSVGEARPIRSTSRREKGHGALAERAIQRLRQAEVVEWYRGLRKAIAEAERAWRRSYKAGDGARHYPAA